MKKILLILLLAIFVVGCSDNGESSDNENTDNEDSAETEKENDENVGEKNKKKDLYQIGETADITSSSYGFPYQITVNSVELTTQDVDGLALEDLNFSAEEGGKFLVANVTIKNTGDSPFIPKEKISAQLDEEDAPGFLAEEDPFPERNEELAPGEEITGNLAYTHDAFEDYDVLYLTYEAEDNDYETKFEIPIPNE
ncbi:DUF4352 domain-containing protein [Virgibacillus sp. M23]|uniref:DUF4352 domain-containing protein n=1 Tax=Virgibacillus sp. M23 TaxID=3079030 RepID=UPI002A920897|nr:DUF4352 domain-containing protein [Virgibacillus sp. M23]MDY7045178.1 DUF4352 domain-containing protein [Virgibacillus sp. M23]